MVDRIPEDLMRIALDKVEGFPFERFCNAFYASLVGATFVPMGGVRDGGADGRIYQDTSQKQTYYQASTEADTEGKIRRTVDRLREFGRSPSTVVYVTSQPVKYSDRLERSLTVEFDVTIAIRDANYLAAHINDGHAAQGAFNEHLRPYTEFLKAVGATSLIPKSKHVTSPAVYVFLAQELARKSGDESLISSVVDALALWALEGTDPDQGILMTSDEVSDKIMHEIPGVKQLVGPRLRKRLEKMASKSYAGGRAVRWHKPNDGFCLPYATRQSIEAENTADEALRLQVKESLDARLEEVNLDGIGPKGRRTVVDVTLRTLQRTFEREGLEFAAFLEASDKPEYATITDSLALALDESEVGGQRRIKIGDASLSILRGVLYDSTEVERRYLGKLARTYAVLFTLNTEPRLIEFFQDMAGDFYLYVGADQIVRALSEHYLDQANQATRNTLLMAARAGSSLILTEPALDEVISHLRICDFEYRNHIAAVEPYLTIEMARSAPKIMLRAYLYGKLHDGGRRKPQSWQAFINQFCTYNDLHKPSATTDLQRYLQITFQFKFAGQQDLENLTNVDEVAKIAEPLREHKKDDRLARNDALVALAVYGHRRRKREQSSVTEFGYSTWWLTDETSILRFTRDVIEANGGDRYILRPDFLLNYLLLAPSAAEVRASFAAIFPSLLGIKLAKRMQPETFHKILGKVAEAEDLDEARRTVVISRAVDKLKSDFSRQYLTSSRSNDE